MKYIQIWKITIIKFGDIEIEKHKFYQYKRPISLMNIDNKETVVYNKASFGKNVLNISLALKMLKNLDLYAYFFQK